MILGAAAFAAIEIDPPPLGRKGSQAESDDGFVRQNNIVVDPLPLREQGLSPSMVGGAEQSKCRQMSADTSHSSWCMAAATACLRPICKNIIWGVLHPTSHESKSLPMLRALPWSRSCKVIFA